MPLYVGNIEYEIPVFEKSLYGQKVPRRPKQLKADLPNRSVSANVGRSVSFSTCAKQQAGGILSTISGVKDVLINYVLGKQASRTNISTKFGGKRRQVSSDLSSYEMDLHGLNQEKGKEIVSDDYFIAVMKENARLRSQVLQMRQSQKQIYSANDHSALQPSSSPVKKHQENGQNLKIWMDKQARLVADPESISSSSETGDLEGKYAERQKLVKATSIAAAVAAGVTAAHQATSKTPRRHRLKAEQAFNGHSTPFKMARDDSGVKLTAPNSREPSRDNFSPKNFTKPNLTQMKQENDRLAKALGLI